MQLAMCMYTVRYLMQLKISYTVQYSNGCIASSPGHSKILSRSRGEKSGEGAWYQYLRHGPEMVDSVS